MSKQQEYLRRRIQLGESIEAMTKAFAEKNVSFAEEGLEAPPKPDNCWSYDRPPRGCRLGQGHWFDGRWYQLADGVPLLGIEADPSANGHTYERHWYPYEVGVDADPSPPQDPATRPVEELPQEVLNPGPESDEEHEWVRISKLPPDRATQAGHWYREDPGGEYGWVRVRKPPPGRETQAGHWYREEWYEETDRWNSTQDMTEEGHFHDGWSYLQRNSYDKMGRRSSEYPYVAKPPLGHGNEHGHWYRGLWFALKDSQPYQENINFLEEGHPYERRWYRTTYAFACGGQRIDASVDAGEELPVKVKKLYLHP